MTITQIITPVPVAPDPAVDSPAEFSQKAAAFVLAQVGLPAELNAFGAQANALATLVDQRATSASTAAGTAAAASQAAIAAANVEPFIAGKAYQQNSCAISQINFQTYRRRATGASQIDPANDTANWRLLAGNGAFVPINLGAASVIDLRLGNYFLKSTSGNVSLSIENCPPDGYSFTLELQVASGSIAFIQAAAIRTPYDAPLLLTAGKTHELMFVTSNGGVRWKLVPANSFSS